MSAIRIPATQVLDESVELVRTLFAPWVGVLWLGVLPARLALVELVMALVAVRGDAGSHAAWLRTRAWMLVACFVLAIFARAVFARACHLGLRAAVPPGKETWRLGAGEAAAQVLYGLAFLAALNASWFLVLPVPILASLHGLGVAVAHEQRRVAVGEPVRRLAHAAMASRPLALLLAFFVAWIAAAACIVAGTQMLLWTLGGATGIDLTVARAATSLLSPHHDLVVAATSMTLVEPFWIAAHVAMVRRLRARETGEDLRAWLSRLTALPEHAA